MTVHWGGQRGDCTEQMDGAVGWDLRLYNVLCQVPVQMLCTVSTWWTLMRTAGAEMEKKSHFPEPECVMRSF